MSTNNISISSSLLSFKNYCVNYTEMKPNNLTTGWGWFVNTDFESEKSKIINSKYNKVNYVIPQKFIPPRFVPSNIRPKPKPNKICSRKSLSNLHELEEENLDDEQEDNYAANVCMKLVSTVMGIVSLAIIYYRYRYR